MCAHSGFPGSTLTCSLRGVGRTIPSPYLVLLNFGNWLKARQASAWLPRRLSINAVPVTE